MKLITLFCLGMFMVAAPTLRPEPFEKSEGSMPIGWCTSKVTPSFTFIDIVKATMYHPVKDQTDSTPNIVADGTKFHIPSASELEWIAVSRDLHKRWGGSLRFGDIVYILAGEKTGFYLVKDTMNKRFKSRIDFLESPGTGLYSFEYAHLYLAKSKKYTTDQLWGIHKAGLVSP